MSLLPPARPEAMRRHNMARVLGEIHRDGALTRAQLTQRLEVSRSTVGALVGELTQLGLVAEVVPSGGAGVGRPSHVVTPRRGGPFVVAVDVDVTTVTIAAVGLGGVVLAREVVHTGKRPTTPRATARLVTDAIPRLRASARLAELPAGLGVSVPGTVDTRTGHVGLAPNLGWHDVDLGNLLAGLAPAGVPVAVGNDANLAVLAERQRGSARDCADVVCLLGRIGVGAGIILGGVPVYGHDGHAGEIGHNVVDLDGPLCHCGKYGCTETFIGAGALLSAAGRPVPPTDEAVAAVFSDARGGEPTALAAVRTVACSLGRTIADLLNTLNPQLVLLGGSLADVLDVARAQLESAIAHFALEAPKRSLRLAPPALGADSALLGAAEIAFTSLLADPLSAAAQSA